MITNTKLQQKRLEEVRTRHLMERVVAAFISSMQKAPLIKVRSRMVMNSTKVSQQQQQQH